MKKSLNILILTVLIIGLTLYAGWAQSQQTPQQGCGQGQGMGPGQGQGQGRGRNGEMRQIIEKYKDNPQFKTMSEELKSLREEGRKKMQSMRSSGQRPDRETMMKMREEREAAFNTVKAKYESQFPDFFTQVEKMKQQRRQMRQQNRGRGNQQGGQMGPGMNQGQGGQMGSGMNRGQSSQMNRQGMNGRGGRRQGNGEMRKIVEKYKDDPEFKTMMTEMRTLRQEMMKKMQAMRQSGQRPDRETMQKNRAEMEAKMNAMKAKYGSKYPDFFTHIEKMRQQRMQNRQNRMNGGGNGNAQPGGGSQAEIDLKPSTTK